MEGRLDVPLHGPSLNIVRRCGPALCDVLQSKFGCVATIDGVDFEGRQKKPTVAAEKRFDVNIKSFHSDVRVRVSVWKGDLTNFPVDAVVNAANEHLQHYGGLALALSTAGGPQIQNESDEYIKKHGTLNTGEAVVSDPGSLPCKKIIHVVGPRLPMNPNKYEVLRAEPLLEKAIKSILDKVKDTHLNSVAIPAISSGLFNYPLPQCANIIVKTVKDYYEKSTGYRPKEIQFVNHDEPTVREMEMACRQILAPNEAMTYSQAAGSTHRSDGKNSTLTVQMGNVHLTLKKGNIEDQQTDVIVNTTFGRELDGEISRALLRKAGYEMQKELRTAPQTGCIITRPYNLQCKAVYHVVFTEMGHGTTHQILSKSVLESLWLAPTNHHKSIAFPAIGTGGLKLQKKEVARIMSDVVADFAQKVPMKMEVHFVIFPSDNETFKAFEEQMGYLRKKASHPSFTHVETDSFPHRDDFHGSRAPSPQISLSGPSNEATREAERWLHDLFKPFGAVMICNNFIQHFGEKEHLQLSRLMNKGVSIAECFDKGRASMTVYGNSDEDVAVAQLQVEAMLCNIQREFVREEEDAMIVMSQIVSFERKMVGQYTSEFKDRLSAFKHAGLWIVKVDKVENAALKHLFDLKKKQLHCFTGQQMFQRIPAQFCEMVSHIGFHAEYAPPDDPACGEGIYFASTVKRAMEVWKEPSSEYVHLVEAEVLTGNSTDGKRGLILPPALKTDPFTLCDSVSGPKISVVFSGYQALPKYIITCKIRKD